MTEETAQKRRRPITFLLIVLSVALTGMLVYDAVSASRAKARGEPPTFLFTLLPPQLVHGTDRVAGLNEHDTGSKLLTRMASVAVPAAAIGLAGLLVLVGLVSRRRRTALQVGLLALLASLGAGFALNQAVGGSQEINRILAWVGLAPQAQTSRARGESARPAATQPGPASPTTAADSVATAGPDVDRVEKIVFASDRSGRWELWTMDPDGSDQRKISNTERIHMQPRLARDGTRLVFTSAEGDKHVIVMMDLATGQEEIICEGDQGTFTADGKSVVFRRDGSAWRRDLAGGTETRITPALWKGCAYPSPSPDGRTLALASRLAMGYNIYLCPMSGGAPRGLVENEGACDPRFSPSGTRLSFQTETHIFTIQPDGKDRVMITLDGGVQHYACWSPDEKFLAYCQGPGPNGPWQIYRTLVDEEADPMQLTGKEPDSGSNMYPEWGLIINSDLFGESAEQQAGQ